MTYKEFLSYFPDYVVQTFHDSLGGHAATRAPEQCGLNAITDLNKNGHGVFFSINRFPGRPAERKQVLCKGVNAWFVDIDKTPMDIQWELARASPLPPSFIVRSKNGLHIYWLADESATLTGFDDIQYGLVEFFKSDPRMADLARVLRIPGFYHMKDPDDPFLVTLEEAHPERRYSEEQMRAVFPYSPPPPPERPVYDHSPLVLSETMFDEIDNFWELLGAINNRKMLMRLSGSHMIDGDIITFSPRHPAGEYIHVNGKMCDAWLDKDGLIGSGSHGGPTWIQWVKWYGRTPSEIARWAREELN